MKAIFENQAVLPMAFAAMLFASQAVMAQTTLRSADGGVILTGELLSVDAENFEIRTEFGELFVRREFVSCSGEGCPEDDQDSSGTAVEEVVLESFDGNIRLTGQLLEVTATDYVIRTVSGDLEVRREFVACEGAACPTTEVASAAFTVAVPDRLGQSILAEILGDFTQSKGYSLTQTVQAGDELASLLIGNEKGEEVADLSVTEMDRDAAIASVLRGETAFALSRDRISLETLSRLSGRTVRDVSELLNEQTVGLDAVSFVMHPDNQIDVVSLEQVRRILTGQIRNWSEIGGSDTPISVHLLSSAKGIDDKLRSRVLNGATVNGAALHDEVAGLNAAINGDPGGFGVMYRSQITGGKMANLVSQCSIYFDNSDFAVQTEEYPLVVRWYQYSAKSAEVPEIAENMRNFIVTDFGQASVASQGLVTQGLRIRAMNDQGARILTAVLASEQDNSASRVVREYLAAVADAKRVSTSLRFLTASTALDSKAVGDVKRISQIIRSPEFAGYEFLIVGFSDSYGAFRSNVTLSRRRAEAVQSILLEENRGYLDRGSITLLGAGPIAPVDCNSNASGRDLNRRVEIWLRPRA